MRSSAPEPAISSYAYANNRPTTLTDPTGQQPDIGSGTTETYTNYYTTCLNNPQARSDQQQADTGAPEGQEANPEYGAAKKTVDESANIVSRIADEVINLILDLVGFNDAKKCIAGGDIVACISTALQAVPWGKIFRLIDRVGGEVA